MRVLDFVSACFNPSKNFPTFYIYTNDGCRFLCFANVVFKV